MFVTEFFILFCRDPEKYVGEDISGDQKCFIELSCRIEHFEDINCQHRNWYGFTTQSYIPRETVWDSEWNGTSIPCYHRSRKAVNQFEDAVEKAGIWSLGCSLLVSTKNWVLSMFGHDMSRSKVCNARNYHVHKKWLHVGSLQVWTCDGASVGSKFQKVTWLHIVIGECLYSNEIFSWHCLSINNEVIKFVG